MNFARDYTEKIALGLPRWANIAGSFHDVGAARNALYEAEQNIRLSDFPANIANANRSRTGVGYARDLAAARLQAAQQATTNHHDGYISAFRNRNRADASGGYKELNQAFVTPQAANQNLDTANQAWQEAQRAATQAESEFNSHNRAYDSANQSLQELEEQRYRASHAQSAAVRSVDSATKNRNMSIGAHALGAGALGAGAYGLNQHFKHPQEEQQLQSQYAE